MPRKNKRMVIEIKKILPRKLKHLSPGGVGSPLDLFIKPQNPSNPKKTRRV